MEIRAIRAITNREITNREITNRGITNVMPRIGS
jgi:hypothetical protein